VKRPTRAANRFVRPRDISTPSRGPNVGPNGPGRRDRNAAELAGVDARIAKAQDSIERYLRAFEDTMPAAQCGTRVRDLDQQLIELRARREELSAAFDADTVEPPSDEVLEQLRNRVAEAINSGTDGERKMLLQALVQEVSVTSRDHTSESSANR
jgi:hypothetical protein